MGNKESKPFVYRRDSFDCRISDYLCEILLSHLSFEDKIRFECISKQFQGLVFNKQKALIYANGDRNDRLPQLWSQPEWYCIPEPNLIAFESLLKKCKSINSLRFNVINNELMNLLTKHCNELKTFYADLYQIDIKVINSFGQKFGQSLQRIGFNYMIINAEKSMIKLCPKLIAIKGIAFNHFIDSNHFIHFEKLTELKIYITSESDMDLFDIFVDKYKTQLKYLAIDYLLDPQIGETFGNQLIKFFRSIAKEFTQLTKFDSNLFNGLEMNEHILHQILIIISQMVNIRKLKLALNDQTIPGIVTTFHPMKDLTSLRLYWVGLTDDSFTDIHKHFPELKTLRLYESGNHITNNVLKSLSKLKSLKTIVLSVGDEGLDLSDEDFIQFINDSKSVKNIAIQSKQEISGEIIEAMISLALRKPELKFKWKLNFGKTLEKYEKKVPKNASFGSHKDFNYKF